MCVLYTIALTACLLVPQQVDIIVVEPTDTIKQLKGPLHKLIGEFVQRLARAGAMQQLVSLCNPMCARVYVCACVSVCMCVCVYVCACVSVCMCVSV